MSKIKFRMLAIVPALSLVLLMGGCGEGTKSEPEKTTAPEVEIEAKKDSGVSADDVKQETKEALETAKEYALQQKEEYAQRALVPASTPLPENKKVKKQHQ